MARKNNLLNLFFGLVGILGSIGVGEIFLSGQLTNGIILGLPGLREMIVHQIVGWTIIGSGIYGTLRMLGFVK